MNNTKVKSMLTVSELAELLGLKRSTIYAMTCAREIPFYKPNGKRIYFDPEEIENWMREYRYDSAIEIARKETSTKDNQQSNSKKK